MVITIGQIGDRVLMYGVSTFLLYGGERREVSYLTQPVLIWISLIRKGGGFFSYLISTIRSKRERQ